MLDLPFVLNHPATGIVLLFIGIAWLAHLVKKPVEGIPQIFDAHGHPLPHTTQPVLLVAVVAGIIGVISGIGIWSYLAEMPESISGVGSFPQEQQAELLPLLYEPCRQIYDLNAFMENSGPSIMIVFQDPRDPEAYEFGMAFRELLQTAGCEDAVLAGAVERLVQNIEPFFGIKIWDGYTIRTREAASALYGALVRIRPDTTITPGGEAPNGGHFEGIALVIGRLNR